MRFREIELRMISSPSVEVGDRVQFLEIWPICGGYGICDFQNSLLHSYS